MDDYNPFLPPAESFDTERHTGTTAEAIRNRYLSHESSVRSIGSIHIAGGFVCLLWPISMYFEPLRRSSDIVPVVLLTLAGVVMFYFALAAYRLQRWSRIPSAIVTVLVGLAGACIGVPIAAYFLYVMFGPNGQMVYSDEYRQIIKQTPQIQYKTQTVSWFVLLILVSLICVVVMMTLAGP